MRRTRHTFLPRYLVIGILRELRNKDIFLWAQAIAFKALVTFVPLVLLGTGLVGQVLRRQRPSEYVETLIRDFFPLYQSDTLIRFLRQLQNSSGTITAIGVVGLILTAVTLFTTLRAVLANIFREEWHEHRSVLRGYVFDFRMALQVGVLFILSIAITLAAQAANISGIEYLTEWGLDYQWLQEGWNGVYSWFVVILPFLLSTAMFLQLFYFTPIPRPPVRSAMTGALVTAVLWEIAKLGFTMFATRTGGFERTWLSALGDTFVLVIALVFWAYYSGIVLNIGAITTVIHERFHRMDRAATASGTEISDSIEPIHVLSPESVSENSPTGDD